VPRIRLVMFGLLLCVGAGGAALAQQAKPMDDALRARGGVNGTEGPTSESNASAAKRNELEDEILAQVEPGPSTPLAKAPDPSQLRRAAEHRQQLIALLEQQIAALDRQISALREALAAQKSWDCEKEKRAQEKGREASGQPCSVVSPDADALEKEIAGVRKRRDQVIRSYNDAVTTPPIVFAEEVLPAPTQPSVAVPLVPTAPATIAPPATSLLMQQRRLALVIGNSEYPANFLANPVNDAADVSAALRKIGFEVTTQTNLDVRGFANALVTFADAAEGADAALIYYAGHAMQIDGVNWLMPLDGRIGSATEVRTSNLNLDDLIADLEPKVGTLLIFLDACRNNPMLTAFYARQRSQNRAVQETRGLARVDANGRDLLVVFATRANDVAQDGAGRNSPFTKAFLDNLSSPGVEIEALMKRVTRAVREGTGGKQEPERLSNLESEFYFVPRDN
jgi:hypothetical protein